MGIRPKFKKNENSFLVQHHSRKNCLIEILVACYDGVTTQGGPESDFYLGVRPQPCSV